MAFDGSMPRRKDLGVATKKKPAATKRMAQKKPPSDHRSAKTAQPRRAGDEPEELRIWRRIIETRDLLTEEVRLFETLAHPICNDCRALGASDEDVAIVAAGAILGATQKLEAFDAKICALRENKGGNYAIQKLVILLKEHQSRKLLNAYRAVVDFLKTGNSKSLKARTLLAVAARSFDGPEIVDIAKTMKLAMDTPDRFDLGTLDDDARAWCNLPSSSGQKSRYSTPSVRAGYIVARATGWDPVRGGGLSPDQVQDRIKYSEPK